MSLGSSSVFLVTPKLYVLCMSLEYAGLLYIITKVTNYFNAGLQAQLTPAILCAIPICKRCLGDLTIDCINPTVFIAQIL